MEEKFEKKKSSEKNTPLCEFVFYICILYFMYFVFYMCFVYTPYKVATLDINKL